MPQILFKDFTRDQSWRDMAEKTDQGENMQTRVFFYNRCFSLTLNLFSDMTLKNRQPQ